MWNQSCSVVCHRDISTSRSDRQFKLERVEITNEYVIRWHSLSSEFAPKLYAAKVQSTGMRKAEIRVCFDLFN
jgi:hypothetical protein